MGFWGDRTSGIGLIFFIAFLASSSHERTYLLAAALMVPTGIFFGVLAYTGRTLNKNSNKHLAIAKQEGALKLLVWEKSLDAWNKLFYCARCDGVFIPGEAGFVPLAQKDAYLAQVGQQVKE